METSKHIFTSLDQHAWLAGIKWIRDIKQAGVKLYVVDTGLLPEQASKLRELNVEVVPLSNKYNSQQVDIFYSMCQQMEEGNVYLFWDILMRPEEWKCMFSVSNFAAIKANGINMSALVFPLSNIDKRVKIGVRFEEELIPKHGSILSSGLMSGTSEGWTLFSGFYASLVSTGLIDQNVFGRNLALNLLLLYFPDWVEVKSVVHQITSLQQANLE
jgi:hypothetical protein